MNIPLAKLDVFDSWTTNSRECEIKAREADATKTTIKKKTASACDNQVPSSPLPSSAAAASSKVFALHA
jgi:hypothetical protein